MSRAVTQPFIHNVSTKNSVQIIWRVTNADLVILFWAGPMTKKEKKKKPKPQNKTRSCKPEAIPSCARSAWQGQRGGFAGSAELARPSAGTPHSPDTNHGSLPIQEQDDLHMDNCRNVHPQLPTARIAWLLPPPERNSLELAFFFFFCFFLFRPTASARLSHWFALTVQRWLCKGMSCLCSTQRRAMSHRPSLERAARPQDTRVSIEPPTSEVRADVPNGSF